MKVSILIVTKNRAADLALTLEALKAVRAPEGLETEWLVIDNGSSDETPVVAKAAASTAFPLQYVHEPHGGQSVGRNRGMAISSGEIILFTDDDVRPPGDWLAGMCDPIIGGRGEAVCGGVKLAPHLRRPWMTSIHRSWLAATEWLEGGSVRSLVGANMAFSRKVLEQVPAFDPELGPGASGFGDDGLFASQLLAAGFNIHDGTGVNIEHHFDASRLTRSSWLGAAEKRGRSQAYRGHHWEHWGCRLGRLKILRATGRLAAWRSRNHDKLDSEGCDPEELDLVFDLALVRAHLEESKRPRNYDRHGLVRVRQVIGFP